MSERAKSSVLPNGNFREFFSLGGFCVFKTGIPGGPDWFGVFFITCVVFLQCTKILLAVTTVTELNPKL